MQGVGQPGRGLEGRHEDAVGQTGAPGQRGPCDLADRLEDGEVIAHGPGRGEHLEVQPVGVHVQHQAAIQGVGEPFCKGRHGGGARVGQPAARRSCDIDRAALGCLLVGAVTVGAPVAVEHLVGRIVRGGDAIEPVDRVSALEGVAMPVHDNVRAVGFEDGVEVFARGLAHGVGVRVVEVLAVRRLVPVGDDPRLGVAGQIVGEPLELGGGGSGAAAVVVGVQADEMDVGVVERVVVLAAGGRAAAFALRGHAVNAPVGAGGHAVMVAAGREDRRVLEDVGIDVEDSALIGGVRAAHAALLVVAAGEPDVGGLAVGGGEVQIGVAHGDLGRVTAAVIAEEPHARGPAAARGRRGDEIVVGTGLDGPGGGANGVIVLGLGRQARERDAVVSAACGIVRERRETAGRRPEADAAHRGLGGAPADGDVGRPAAAQIRPARDGAGDDAGDGDRIGSGNSRFVQAVGHDSEEAVAPVHEAGYLVGVRRLRVREEECWGSIARLVEGHAGDGPAARARGGGGAQVDSGRRAESRAVGRTG